MVIYHTSLFPPPVFRNEYVM